MKRLLKTKFAIIVITVLVCIIAFSGVAYAAGVFNKNVPATVTLKATTPGLTLYSDEACTLELTTVSFGEVPSGDTKVINVWLKNTGNKNFSSITASSNLDAGIGTIEITNLTGIDKGLKRPITITLTTLESVVDLNPNITIIFSGSY